MAMAKIRKPAPRWRAFALGLCCVPAAACAGQDSPAGDAAVLRRHMVEQQLVPRGIDDARVLEAMRNVPRHRFVPDAVAADAYDDGPLSIGYGQTISQPYIVALMTQLARPAPGDRVLEVGTGSGYQAAVLAGLVEHVYSIEIVAPLAQHAAGLLAGLGYDNVTVKAGDGYAGWPAHAPFDAIVVTAAPERIPAPLLEQLRPGGRLVIPVGPMHAAQQLRVVEKDAQGRLHERHITPVRFVPLTGEAAERDRGGR